MELLANLNPEQLEAVTLPAQSALILAGAGSGKTRVLTTRIAWLLSTRQASPGGILAVTFTNKAAKEMLTRLGAMLPINPRGMWIGTFHGLCNRFLRAHYRDAGLPQLFQIMDTADQLALIKRMLKSLNVDDEKYPAKGVQWFINDAKEEGRRPNAVEAYDDFSRRQVEFYSIYEQWCAREGVVDFPELLLRCYETLARNPALCEHYRARFRHILVDEFQDTNRLQYAWLKLIAGPGASVFAVGDDDQSIYAFRGADVGNMQHFEHDFAREGAPVRLIKLEQNYRSHSNILDAANALISHNSERLGKNLWTDAGHGEPLRVYAGMSDAEEAAFIVDTVQGLASGGTALADMAILYRSNAQSRVIEHALFSAGLPYRVYGGLRFFERQEIKHALAYLRLINNPDDDNALLRVINFPPRGIGARSLEQLQDAANGHGVTLWAAACGNVLGGKAGASVAAFVRLVEGLRATTQGLPLAEVVEQMNAASGLIEHYKNEKEGQDRIENLEELINAAATFDQEGLPPDDGTEAPDPLTAFLTHAALEAGDTQAGEGRDALQLMTVHAAKGLEFHTVFVTGLEEGLFPHDNSIADDHGVEEERRLMYVALTRARRRLYLTLAQARSLHGQFRYNVPSRFLDEIPQKLVQWLSPQPRSLSAAGGFAPAWAGGGSSGGYGGGSGYRSGGGSASGTRSGGQGGYGGGYAGRGTQASEGGTTWRVGQNVRHAKFGVGVIVSAEGSGSEARVQVNFREAGAKWLALEYAKLEAV